MTGNGTLPDAADRARVVNELDGTLFVEAGAGSGKTSSLVDRITNLVAGGVPVSRIAAITFTEAAARELRHRVREALEARGEAQRDRTLIVAAGEVESAAFTTLHGFALRLLMDHPVEADLPPGFGVADEIASLLEFERSWRLFTARIGDDLDLLDLQERASVLSVELRRFIDIARRFDDNWDLIATVDRTPPPLSPLDLGPLLTEAAALGPLADQSLSAEDKLAVGIREFAAEATDMIDADALSQLEWLATVRWPTLTWGRKDSWVRSVTVAEARAEVGALKDRIAEAVDVYRGEVIAQFIARVADFVDVQVEARRARGELSFHDLLVLARRLLRGNSRVREALHQRYDRLLLDEFQDTDPIQIELAVLIAASGEVGTTPWPELAAALQPGKLVVVGDPKQSIYRFRRADMAVYQATEDRLAGDTTRLTTNFRSVPGVVGFVNEVFTHLIGDGEPGAQPAYHALDAERRADPEPETSHPVLVLGGEHPKATAVNDIRREEATDVASVICTAMAEEWRTERTKGTWVPLRLQDIAVLIPSRLSLPSLEAAFAAANIPFRPETSSLVYATQEIRDVMAGVRAVVNPAHAIDVVAALRSGLFSIGDDHLLSWYRLGGSWNYELRDRLLDESEHTAELMANPVWDALGVLRTWHAERWWTTPSALIERIITERRLREVALAAPRPRDRWRRYRFLAEQARLFSATQGGDLSDFVAWTEIQASDLARITEPIPAEPDDDAVRVLTVHGSKGLEFPMVILAGAPTVEANRARGPQVLFTPAGEAEVRIGRGRVTQGYEIQASVEEVLDRFERVRLQYVAATRARDLLVVSAHHKEGSTCGGRRMWHALTDVAGWAPFERPDDAPRYRVEPPTQLRLGSGSFGDTERAWRNEQNVVLDGAAEPGSMSATALAELLAPEPAAGSETAPGAEIVIDDDRPEWRRDGRGAPVGTAVHATLQMIDFAAPDDLDAVAVLEARQAGVPELATEVAALARAALAAPVMDLARANRHWRELYVAATIGETLVEGFIDLCVETDAGLVVVDYKTDLVSGADEAAEKVQFYRIQGATYALALERIVGQPVSQCVFVFAGPDGPIEHTVEDLAAAMRQITEALGAEGLSAQRSDS
ncbi:MAG: UvrD-helicase domain-containing protein [Actinomycetota bacterium]